MAYRFALILVVLASVLAFKQVGTPPRPLDVSLTIRSRLSPFESVQYELKRRGDTVIVALTRTLALGFGQQSGIGLVPDEAMPDLLDRLQACHLGGIDDPTDPGSTDPTPPSDPSEAGLPETSTDNSAGSPRSTLSADPSELGPPDASTGTPAASPAPTPLIDLSDTTYELTVVLGDLSLQEQRSGDRILPTSPFWCVASIVMDACETFGEPVPFLNPFYDPGEYGELYVDSEPPARVIIDGRDTGLFTPIVNLRLSPGRHDIRFVNSDLGIDRQYDVTIVIGLTTRLDVELR